MEEAFDGMSSCACDMCRFGLRLPKQGPFLRKRTKLVGTVEIMENCSKMCQRDHEHCPVLGGVRVGEKWMPVSEFAGGYTAKFAKAVVEGAEKYLLKGKRPEIFVEGGYVPEEQFQEEDEPEDAELEEVSEFPGGRDSRMQKIQLLHRRLGHPTNQTLARMLKLGGAANEVVEMAQHYKCPVCVQVGAPGRYLKQKPYARTTVFGRQLHCDLKYIHDYNNKLFVALSVVDAATSFHMAVLLKNRQAAHCARKLLRHWVSLYGAPQEVVLDQGGEFDGEFVGWLETHGIQSRHTGAKSPWQHGFSERHGALLGTAVSALIWEYKAKGREEVKDCLAAAIQGKNQTVSRNGYSPYQMVFGREPTFPDLLDESSTGNLSLRQALSHEGEVQRSAEMRVAAKAALLRQDCQEKLRRALRRWPRGEQQEFSPGEQVFFYSPKPNAARFRKDGGAWRGPAVSWRGRCLLVSAPNLRSASALEAGDFEGKLEEIQKFENGFEEEKNFEDLSGEAKPPEVSAREEEEGWTPQEGSLRRSKGGRKKQAAKEIAKTLKGLRIVGVRKTIQKRKKQKDEVLEGLEGGSERHCSPPRGAEESLREVPAMDPQTEEAVRKQLTKFLGEPRDDGYKERLRKHLQDDVPMQFRHKRVREEEAVEKEASKRFRPGFFNYTMLSIAHSKKNRANEWASRSEVRKLGQLLDLPLTSVRYHLTPRKRMQKPPDKKSRGRVTIMFGSETGTAMVCEEGPDDVKKHPKKKVPHEWMGMTLFTKEGVREKKPGNAYVELPWGVYQVSVGDIDQWQKLSQEEVENQAFSEAFLLISKANGKELDPRHFDEKEKAAFDEADKKEWTSWVRNRVVRRLTPEEVKNLNKNDIFRAPARILRVNKGALHGTFIPKSRIVIPGHLDPHLGSFRSDAPTTLWVAVQMSKCIAASKRWLATVFDVTTAFLSGKEIQRKVVVRGPPDGLPAVEDEPAVEPFALLQLCKSAYGLSEAPRLWYLRARELLLEVGFEELSMARASFVMKVGDNVVAILCLHVDDGLLVAEPSTMQNLKDRISSKFTIKEWQDLGEKPVTFLGVSTTYKNYHFYDDMTEYIEKVEPAKIEVASDALLHGAQLSAFRRLIMQLRWPAHLVMPEFLYRTSYLAQAVSGAKGSDLAYANKMLGEMKEAAKRGEALVKIQPLKGKPMFVSYFDASLGTSKQLKGQQGEIHFLTTEAVSKQLAAANVLEFHSSRIHRVVRSSLAAESCAMSGAMDRMLFNRVLFDALNYGKLELSAKWRYELRCKGCLVTDARSLHDHMQKTGGVASEKQTALDMLMVKQLVEDQVIGPRWTPTWKQIADPLAKEMVTTLLEKFRKEGLLCLIQTAEDEQEEEYRSGIRRAQRERRKERMKSNSCNILLLQCD